MLTEDRRYRVQYFIPDYDIIKTSNTVRTGVSILYKKSFGGAQSLSDTTKPANDEVPIPHLFISYFT